MNISGRYSEIFRAEIFRESGFKNGKTKGKSYIVNPLSLQEENPVVLSVTIYQALNFASYFQFFIFKRIN